MNAASCIARPIASVLASQSRCPADRRGRGQQHSSAFRANFGPRAPIAAGAAAADYPGAAQLARAQKAGRPAVAALAESPRSRSSSQRPQLPPRRVLGARSTRRWGGLARSRPLPTAARQRRRHWPSRRRVAAAQARPRRPSAPAPSARPMPPSTRASRRPPTRPTGGAGGRAACCMGDWAGRRPCAGGSARRRAVAHHGIPPFSPQV